MSKAVFCFGVFLLLIAIGDPGCTTGVEPSPHPGIVRVTLTSDQSDTSIVILGDTTRFSRYDQYFALVYGGRVYRGANYADLYEGTGINHVSSDTVNLLGREWLDGVPINIRDTTVITPQNSRYRTYVIFEWLLPPGSYDNLEFSLVAGEVQTYLPTPYFNPISLPQGVQPQMYFPVSFSIQEDKVTQIDLQIAPFRSLHRYQDSFLFDRQMNVIGVRTL